MRRFFQTEWHGIRFDTFCTPVHTRLADSDFYSAFYKKFFERYRSINDLPADWLASKSRIAQFISETARTQKAEQILSMS